MEGPEVKRAVWIRWLFGVITAVIVSIIIFNSTYRQDSIRSCVTTSARSNAQALNWEFAARARKRDGDLLTSDEYTKNVREIRANIPMPDDWHGDLNNRGLSQRDRIAGCRDAFDPLIPFVR